MCGIAGYYGTREIGEDRVAACLAQMRRRGPDHAAHCRLVSRTGRNVYLLNSRLRIVDLEARSNQPFHLGSRWLTYNGELYNYVEVKADLMREGEAFSTMSDTEVLMRALDTKGDAVLDRFEGMWAFALFDTADDSLRLCRDRFGEKPLYLYRDATGLYFGSEVKFLFTLLGHQLPVNQDHLYRYLVNGYKALYKTPSAFFRGIEELAPASLLCLDAHGKESERRYWTGSFRPDDAMTYDEAVAGVRERLIHSVKLRLRADVPLAFCMSGGVDSNALISIAKRVLDYDVHGFTIMNTDERYEESDLVAAAVRELGLRHTPVPTDTTGFLGKLRTLVRQHDAPVYTITYYAHWLLMEQIAAAGYRIAVSGTAADELFSGYYDHHLAYLYEVRDESSRHAHALAAWREHIAPVVRNPFLSDPALFIRDPGFREHIYLGADEFAACLRRPWSEPFAEATYTTSLLRNRMLNELFHEAVPVILHEDDLNAMYFSVENRSPYLDRDLFDYCFSIPSRHLVRDGYAKAILRDSMRDIVPDVILNSRRKIGFNAPIAAFLDVQSSETRAELLAESPVYDIVRQECIADLLDRGQLPNSQSKFLFYFLCAKMFLEEFGA